MLFKIKFVIKEMVDFKINYGVRYNGYYGRN